MIRVEIGQQWWSPHPNFIVRENGSMAVRIVCYDFPDIPVTLDGCAFVADLALTIHKWDAENLINSTLGGFAMFKSPALEDAA